jgi:putative spermidine/putrescine transport system permease protein
MDMSVAHPPARAAVKPHDGAVLAKAVARPVPAAACAADVVWHRLSGIADPAVAGFYTFDDFTMAVTPDLTLANIQALSTRQTTTSSCAR